ncbi:MAG: GGDEF domain-containing protein [Brevinematia bacterium]
MKIFLNNDLYYNSYLVTDTDDETILQIYNSIFSSQDQIKAIYSLIKKTKDPKFFQKLIFLLTGINFEEELAKTLWEEIEKYYKEIIHILGRHIHISAVVVDYMFRVKNHLKNPSVVDLILTERVKDLALQDFLTGLYKGILLEDFVTKEINRSKRHNHSFSIVMFQVNRLESLSISGNISVVTKILVDIGNLIRDLKRSEDMGFRLSTGKFAIILPNTDKRGAILFAKRLITEIENVVLAASRLIFGISISLGIQSFPEDGDNTKTLISNVEKTCYKSSIMGPNKIVYEL